MRNRIKNIKANSREILLPGYMYYIPVLFLYFIIGIIASAIPVRLFSADDMLSTFGRFGISFITSVFTGLAGVGLIKATFDYINREPVKPSTLFYAFKHNSDQFVIVTLIITAIKTVFSLMLILAEKACAAYELSELVTSVIYYGCSALILFLTMIATVRIMWANYFIIEGEASSASEALKKSMAFSKGRTGEILYMKLSFAGYYILAIFSLFVGFLYVKPYTEVTYLMYYLENK